MESLLENYSSIKECHYKNEHYSVRINGAVLRNTPNNKRTRPTDKKWTFGKLNIKTGYMEIASVRIHRIIATPFHGKPSTKEHVVDHADTNKIMKKQFLLTLFLIGLTFMGSCQNNIKGTDTKSKINVARDSVLIFKTDTIKFYSFSSIDPQTGKWKPAISEVINYHKIDLKDKSLTFIYQTKEQKDWSMRKMFYDSITAGNNGTSLYYNSGYFENSFLDTLNSKTIAHVLNDDHYMRFTNLKRISISELEKLKIREDEIIQKKEPKVYSNSQRSSENFEYSNYWRKEAFKKTILLIKQRLKKNTPSCVMVSRSSYNSNLVRFIGQNGYRIKLYVEFDCNQDYINPSYFWVNAFYLGENKWDLEVVDYKLTH